MVASDQIDAHVHIFPEYRHRHLIRWIRRFYPEHPGDEHSKPAELLDDLLGQGISKVINLVYPVSPEETVSLNRFNADFAEQHENVYAVGSLHQDNKNKKDLMRQAFEEFGLMGLKFHSFVQDMDLSNPAMEEVWLWCERWGRPIYLHTGFDHFYGKKLTYECIYSILQRHPELNLVLSHLLFPDIQKAFALAEQFAGIYLDLSSVLISMQKYGDELLPLGKWHAEDMIEYLKAEINKHSGRILFGSDYPLCGGSLSDAWESLDLLGLDDEGRQRLTCSVAQGFIDKFSTN